MSTLPASNVLSLEQLLNTAQDGVFAIDRNRQYVIFNTGCERITGQSAKDVLGKSCNCSETVSCVDLQGRSLAGVLCPAKALFDGLRNSARQRMEITRADRRRVFIETIYSAVRDSSGAVHLVLGIMRDATESHDREVELIQAISGLREQMARISEEQRSRYGFDNLLTRSPAMEPVLDRMRAAIRESAPVLIQGEPGSGKETIAKTIHANGRESNGPLVSADCSTFARENQEVELFGGPGRGRGLIGAAANGTLFLDRITSLTPGTQAKLQRMIESGRIEDAKGGGAPLNARIICGTDRPAAESIRRQTLREDLYYSLSVISIEVPPLRDRREDIILLVQEFVESQGSHQHRQIKSIEPDAWEMLVRFDWPGNVRELKQAIESACAMGEGSSLRVEDFPPEVQGLAADVPRRIEPDSLELDPYLERIERDAILNALAAADWQRNKAAELMKISRSRLYRRMEALGIDPRDHP